MNKVESAVARLERILADMDPKRKVQLRSDFQGACEEGLCEEEAAEFVLDQLAESEWSR